MSRNDQHFVPCRPFSKKLVVLVVIKFMSHSNQQGSFRTYLLHGFKSLEKHKSCHIDGILRLQEQSSSVFVSRTNLWEAKVGIVGSFLQIDKRRTDIKQN